MSSNRTDARLMRIDVNTLAKRNDSSEACRTLIEAATTEAATTTKATTTKATTTKAAATTATTDIWRPIFTGDKVKRVDFANL